MPQSTARAMVVAWIQVALTLRTYLAALPVPINIGNPADPIQLAGISADLTRAYEVINDAPIPAAHVDLLRETTCMLLVALGQIGVVLHNSTTQIWQAEGVHLLLSQASGKLNSLNDD